MQITTIGLDLAKSVFQVHGVDASGQVVVRKSLRRAQMLPFFAKLPPCLVGIEACGTSHYWARELIKLGHEVRLMPPAYVKPYVKRGEDRRCRRGSGLRGSDAADDAVRAGQVARAAGGAVDASDARPAGQAAHAADQHDPRSIGRIWRRHSQGAGAGAADARQIVDGKAPEVPIEAARIVATLSQQAPTSTSGSARSIAIWPFIYVATMLHVVS